MLLYCYVPSYVRLHCQQLTFVFRNNSQAKCPRKSLRKGNAHKQCRPMVERSSGEYINQWIIETKIGIEAICLTHHSEVLSCD